MKLGRHIIIQGDCFDSKVQRQIKAHKPNLIISDPPFNITDLKFDNAEFDMEQYVKLLKSVFTLHTWLFSFQTIQMYPFFMKEFRLKFDYVWYKLKPTMKSYNTIAPFKQHELIFVYIHPELKKMTELTFNKKALRTPGKRYTTHKNTKPTEFMMANRIVRMNDDFTYRNDGYREGISTLRFPSKGMMKLEERTPHPTQKPLAMVELLLNGYTNPNDIVFDFTLGSGTTLLAAERTGRTCIGIEKNPEYFDMILKRWDKRHEIPMPRDHNSKKLEDWL